MKAVVKLAREGGVAHFPGLAKAVEVDLSAWSEAERAALAALLARMPAQPPVRPDRQVYRCTFAHTSGETTVYIDPAELADEAAGLFARLVEGWRQALG